MPDCGNRLWLDRALASIGTQTIAGKRPFEVVVGLDHGVTAPKLEPPRSVALRFVNASADRRRGQAAAINTAAKEARGDLFAILEDDDAWRPLFLKTAVATLVEFDFVSSSQMLLDRNGLPSELMYFPTPSGWVMRRELWDEIGGFDEAIRFHVDMDWIGRLNQAGKRRAHLVEAGFPIDRDFLQKHRKWLAHLAAGQPNPVTLVQHGEPAPLVVRSANPGSGTSRIRNDPDATRQSKKEMAAFRKRFGTIPW